MQFFNVLLVGVLARKEAKLTRASFFIALLLVDLSPHALLFRFRAGLILFLVFILFPILKKPTRCIRGACVIHQDPNKNQEEGSIASEMMKLDLSKLFYSKVVEPDTCGVPVTMSTNGYGATGARRNG